MKTEQRHTSPSLAACHTFRTIRRGLLVLLLPAALSAVTAWSQSGKCVAVPSGAVSWWRAENNALDSIDGNNGTLLNGTAFASGMVGQAFNFNGTNQSVSISNSPSLNPTNFTVETWLNPAHIPQPGEIAMDVVSKDGETFDRQYLLTVDEHQVFRAHVWTPFGMSAVYGNVILSSNTWYHAAMTYDGSSLKLYVNGVLDASIATPSPMVVTTQPFRIGGGSPAGTPPYYFQGKIDEVSFYNRALTSNEIAAIYGASSAGKCAATTACAPQASGIVSWWRADANALDSIDGNHGTLAGNATYTSGKVGQAFSFDGNRDGVAVGTGTNLQLQNFTFEGWIKRASASVLSFDGNGNGTLFANGTGGGGYNFYVQNNNVLALGKSQINAVTSAASVTDTNWHHIAVTKSGTTVFFYVDGVAYAAPAYDSGGFTFTAPAYLGAWLNPSALVDNSFYGAIDEFAVYNRALASNEIASIYLAGTVGKCAVAPPPVPPAITTQPTNQTVIQGGGVTFNVAASGDTPLRYQWRFNGTNIVNQTNTFLTLANVQASNAGPYSVVVTNAAGSATSSNALLTVFLPPVIVTNPVGKSVFVGEDVQFSVLATGTVPLRYQWRFNGAPLAGQTNATLSLGGVQSNNGGQYSVVVTNLAGTATSSNALLTVNPPPPCTAIPSGIVSWWRAESNALDSVDGNHGTLAGNAAFTRGRTGQAFSFDGDRDGVAVGTGTNLQLQDFSFEGWIKRASASVLSFNGNGNGTIFANGTGGGYNFYVESDNLLALGKSQVNVVTSAASITDTNWHHVAVTKQGTTVFFYVDGVAYPAPAYNSGGFTFTAPAYVGAWLNPDGLVDNSFYGAIDELAVYNRALNSNEVASIYLASVTSKCGVPPFIVTQPVSQKVTVGSNANFSVVADGTPQLRYQWRLNTTNIAGASGAQYSFTVASDSGGLYSVRVTNAFGTAISSNALLTVNFIPVAQTDSLSTFEDTALPVTLAGSDANGDALTYSIVSPPAHGVLTGSGTNRLYTPDSNYNGPDSFTFKVNDGLVDSAPATVSITVIPVNDPPVAFPQTVALDEDTTANIVLVASDVDNDPLVYTLSSPAHGSLTGTPPNLTYHPSTNYYGPDSFTFSVSDGQTNSNTATVSITVRPVNDAPVAKITVSPLTQLFDLTNDVVVAPVCGNGTVILDGSQSSDVENDPLTFAWSEGTNSLGSGVIVTNQFAPGTHEITLMVSDGQLTGSAHATVEVVTPAQAIAIIIAYIEDGGLKPHKDQPLTATLRAAAASFDRCNIIPGVNQLQAFQNKVRAQVTPANPDLATKLINAAQQIINAVEGN